MAKKVQLLTADGKQEVLHPETAADMVNVSATKNLTQKLSELEAEFKRYLPLTGGTLTGALSIVNNSVFPNTPNVLGTTAYNQTPFGLSITKTDNNATANGFPSTFSTTLTVKQQDARQFQLSANNTGSSLHWRAGHVNNTGGTATGWSVWNEIYHTANKPNAQDVGALPITGGTITGNLAVNGSLTSGGMTAPNNLWLTTNNGDVVVQLNTSSNATGYLRSYRSAVDDIGNATYRWRNIWASNGTIQTSDERMKEDIRDIDDEQFFEMVKGVSVNTYVMKQPTYNKNGEEVISEDVETYTQETASSERVQCGIIAQELDKFDCGKYILVKDEESDILSINNYNFTSAIMGALKVEISKREELEDLVLELKKEVDTLKAKVA